MASSSKTEKIGLSQFSGTDVPDWRTDYNGDMKKIDDQFVNIEESILDTKEEIEANTFEGKFAGANGVKEMFAEVTDSLNTRFTSSITSAKICFRHFLFSGSIVAGQCVKLGGIINAIPVEYDLVGVLLTPRASVHIAMSWLPDEEYSIYAYSETFSGVFSYDALAILAR